MEPVTPFLGFDMIKQKIIFDLISSAVRSDFDFAKRTNALELFAFIVV